MAALSSRTNRILITLVIVLIMAGITFYLIHDQIQPAGQSRVEVPVQNTSQPRRSRNDRPAQSELLPPLELRHLDGSPLKLSDYSGKIVLLNIYSANFPNSLDEMRSLKPIYDKFLLDPRLVMIGLTSEQDIDALKQFAAENSINWLQATSSPTASDATKTFLASPQLLILGKDGGIIERPQDFWDAFALLSELLPRIKPIKPPGIAIEFEQLPNQPTDNPQALPFTRIPPPSATDAATQAKISVIDGRLHGLSGPPSILNDGKLPSTNDSPRENLFFIAKSIEGRFLIDLGSQISVAQINSYTWHAHERSPQVFRVYVSEGLAANFILQPKFGTDPRKFGWALIADIDTRPAPWPRGITGISIHKKDPTDSLGTFRYLLFLAFPTETHDPQGHTFFAEIDVISAN